jgi:hypothetical protein
MFVTASIHPAVKPFTTAKAADIDAADMTIRRWRIS